MNRNQNIVVQFLLSLMIVGLVSCKEESVSETNFDSQSEHPNLIITAQGVKDIRAQLGNIPIFDNTLKAVQEEVDAEIALGIETPIPKRLFWWIHARTSQT